METTENPRSVFSKTFFLERKFTPSGEINQTVDYFCSPSENVPENLTPSQVKMRFQTPTTFYRENGF